MVSEGKGSAVEPAECVWACSVQPWAGRGLVAAWAGFAPFRPLEWALLVQGRARPAQEASPPHASGSGGKVAALAFLGTEFNGLDAKCWPISSTVPTCSLVGTASSFSLHPKLTGRAPHRPASCTPGLLPPPRLQHAKASAPRDRASQNCFLINFLPPTSLTCPNNRTGDPFCGGCHSSPAHPG